jgi:hypothetical protein
MSGSNNIAIFEKIMKSRWLTNLSLLLLIMLMTGCSSKNKGKIEGTTWSSQATSVKGTPIPEGFVKLVFGADGSLTYRMGPLTYKGKYSLGMGDNVTMTFDQELEGKKTHVEKISINGDQLTMTDSDGTQVQFKKGG